MLEELENKFRTVRNISLSRAQKLRNIFVENKYLLASGGGSRQEGSSDEVGAVALEELALKLETVQYMSLSRAQKLRRLIVENNYRSIVEVGTYQGKGAAYLGAIAKEVGGKVLTIDRPFCLGLSPNVYEVIKIAEVTDFVKVHICHRSYTWDLGKMMRSGNKFDFCYFDGGHTWDATGLGFTLVDRMLNPGGMIVFDDLTWTINSSIKSGAESEDVYAEYDREERGATGVGLVFNALVTDDKYYKSIDGGIGIAKKR